MDQAAATRHLSSPSPTSPFLFQHHSLTNERASNFAKSSIPSPLEAILSPDVGTSGDDDEAAVNALPLVTSDTSDVINAAFTDDCFSSTTTSSSLISTKISNNVCINENRVQETGSPSQNGVCSNENAEEHPVLVENIETTLVQPSAIDGTNVNHAHNGGSCANVLDVQQQLDENQPHSRVEGVIGDVKSNINRDDQVNSVIESEDNDGDDDDDDDEVGMHNMLSGASSSSSSSRMPLLTSHHGSHHHEHPFSRISLEEYSPLSLVDDCVGAVGENALPISPTSLATSFNARSSFQNGFHKMDHSGLVGDDVDVVVGSGADCDPARSLSPTLLTGSSGGGGGVSGGHGSVEGGAGGGQSAHQTSHHSHTHNLWSNSSSTAITQSTSLLNGSSASFLLSQHQLSLMHQLQEPQSIDEAPTPFATTLNGASTAAGSSGGHLGAAAFGSLSLDHIGMHNNSLAIMHRPSSEPPPGTSADLNEFSNDKSTTASSQPTVESLSNKKKVSAVPSSTGRCSSAKSRRGRDRASIAANNQRRANAAAVASASIDRFPAQSSKIHLHLNHHKKLQELQQRLFGPSDAITPSIASPSTSVSCKSESERKKASSKRIAASARLESGSTEKIAQSGARVKEEPDSSVVSSNLPVSQSKQRRGQVIALPVAIKKTRSGRPVRNRKARENLNANKVTAAATCASSDVVKAKQGQTNSNCSGASTNNNRPTARKTVTTETAEPDTTTKGSDSIKLADLLSSSTTTTSSSSNKTNFILNGVLDVGGDASGSGEKKVQQIQLQVSPSLTLVANGSLIGLQQQQQQPQQSQQQPTSVAANSSNSGTCKAQAVVAASTSSGVGAQLRNLLSSNELLKGGDALLSNLCNNNPTGNQAGSTSSSPATGTAPIGTHQIAIQVICQDGTSLVLPVTSAAGLNTSVSLAPGQQQLQTVLANSADLSSLDQHRTASSSSSSAANPLPVLSITNGVSQQPPSAETKSAVSTSVSAANTVPPTGLAASSPTLAALLDAAPNRTAAGVELTNALTGQSFVSTNLLRRMVSGNSSNAATPATVAFQGTTLAVGVGTGENVRGSGNTEKRIKLEGGIVSEPVNESANSTAPAAFALIDSQGLIVTNGNAAVGSATDKSKSSESKLNTGTSQNNRPAVKTTVIATTTGSKLLSGTSVNGDCFKQTTKMNNSSSTGNRQVDPAQPFRCEHCNSTFTRLGNFTRHKKIHMVPTKDGQRFKCDVCSKSFLQRCDLARHLHIHRGTEPHRCNICGKGYIRHSDLVTHQRFHNKEKPFGCPHCSKGFCQRGDLNRHLRSIHLQMKPILCPCCNKKFAKQETLLRHLNTAHRSKPAGAQTGVLTTSASAASSNITTTTITTTVSDASASMSSKTLHVVQSGTKNSVGKKCVSSNNSRQLNEKTTITVVANPASTSCSSATATITNTSATTAANQSSQQAQKNAQVVSIQAIQATLCKPSSQSIDPSTTPTPKAVSSPHEQESDSSKAVA